MRILVVGGAGYIGSVTAAELLAAGHQVVVYDSFISGHAAAVPPDAELVVGDVRDQETLTPVFSQSRIDAVVYYGGFIQAGESMRQPGRYFANNIGGVICLLNTMLEYDVRRFVFSSSAAIYGEPEAVPIPEDAPTCPVNPYGESKAVVERLLRWYDSQCGLRYVSLRYFNAAGAMDTLGEDHRPETHLIPIVLQVALGQRDALPLYGSDYPTADGTCVRDYIHVADLARAHVLALDRLNEGSAVYNLGNSQGFSNLQVIEAARKVAERPIPVHEEARRPGDPPVLVASAEKAKAELGWQPQVTALEEIIDSAWRWHREHPQGYG
ncbi:MAG: UDP-glucose 4-epimerase GalE [Chloroflexota bacterium]|nr:UDP-glucose 4-epimerase GalE [Chloroflexota bacterium]